MKGIKYPAFCFILFCLSGTTLGQINTPQFQNDTEFESSALIGSEYFPYTQAAQIDIKPLTNAKEARRRTLYYYGWVVFNIGKYPKSRQTLFISTLRNANCNPKYRSSWAGEIRTRFLEHVKAYYKPQLTAYHFRARGNSLGSYWRYDTGNVIAGMRARHVRRYTNVVNVPDFVYYCK